VVECFCWFKFFSPLEEKNTLYIGLEKRKRKFPSLLLIPNTKRVFQNTKIEDGEKREEIENIKQYDNICCFMNFFFALGSLDGFIIECNTQLSHSEAQRG
jgi:hypothetical protein